MSYTKLASSILTSTIWMEDDSTRLVWLTLLAMADKHGEVQASIPGLANVARVPVEACRVAIAKFLSPDPDSRTKKDEGRRIEEMPGGWILINHAEYRRLASDDDRKQKAAERQQRARDRKARNEIVTPESRQISHAEADTDTEEPKKDIRLVFDYWREKLSHASAKFSDERKAKIAARLKDGFSVEQLKRAIDGCLASEFHQGKNDDGRKHDGIDLILRNASYVEKFIGYAEGSGNDRQTSAEEEYVSPIEQFRRRNAGMELLSLEEYELRKATASASS